VLAEKRVAAAVLVASGTTLEEAEVTAPVLIVLKFRVRPGYAEAVGSVTEMLEAELKITNTLVSGTVNGEVVTGVVTLATAKAVFLFK
jgi:hypothetical protein